jgi:prepilin-type N-terminal cleavage/methylation domain-containing protein
MDVKHKKSGFTLVELLTTLTIIAMLIGLLIPAFSLVSRITKETKQRAQLGTIGLALTTFKNDYDNDYPPSDWPVVNPPPEPPTLDYCGAQKLAEALLGWDLLGFHPDSHWQANGRNKRPYTPGGGIPPVPPPQYWFYDPNSGLDMGKRKGPYLELATANAFRLGFNPARPDPEGLFPNPLPLIPDTYVICDVFGVKPIRIGPRTVKAGAPILYYKANVSTNAFAPPARVDQRRYDAYDNDPIVQLGQLKDNMKRHRLGLDIENFYRFDFDGGVRDPKITARPWPYRPDSYILISAGADGEYGTKDDIRNFGK